MERRLLRAIINPAMIARLGSLGLVLVPRTWMSWGEGWFHGKLAMLLILSFRCCTGYYARWRRHFAADARIVTMRKLLPAG